MSKSKSKNNTFSISGLNHTEGPGHNHQIDINSEKQKLSQDLKWISSGDLRLVPLELFEANKDIDSEMFFQVASVLIEAHQKFVIAIYGLDKQDRKIKKAILCNYNALDHNIYIDDPFKCLKNNHIDDDLLRELKEIQKSYQAKTIKLIMSVDIEEINKEN